VVREEAAPGELTGKDRKLAYLEVLREGMREHLGTFRLYPPKR
jgi:hypothetical protein